MWIIIPFIDNWQQTKQAALDGLAQVGFNCDLDVKILLINNGSSRETQESAEEFASDHPRRVYLWNHNPSLPSLGCTWNTALDFCWALGEGSALVMNNDVRLKMWTLKYLHKQLVEDEALFVSAIGVTQEQFDAYREEDTETVNRAGAGFSCFLISKEMHKKYRFDENFVPAYCEDLDTHRRVMLGGEGHRMYNINVPYLHYGSGTLKSMSPERRAQVEQAIELGSRAYYVKKWGGPVNEETYLTPFKPIFTDDSIDLDLRDEVCHITTPDIQRHGCRGWL